MRKDNPWKKLSTKIVYQNPWMRIVEDKTMTPTGSDGLYAYLDSKDSVIIAVLNDKDELYVHWTFAYPVQSWNWELPGGGSDGEHTLAASKRELEEETGIIAASWEKLGETRVCNGFMTEHMHTYLARDLSFAGTKEEADEQIGEAKFVPMNEIDAMVQRGDINDGQSITAIHLAQKWLEKQRKQPPK